MVQGENERKKEEQDEGERTGKEKGSVVGYSYQGKEVKSTVHVLLDGQQISTNILWQTFYLGHFSDLGVCGFKFEKPREKKDFSFFEISRIGYRIQSILF